MRRLSGLIATLSAAAFIGSVLADQFQDTCATFGTTLTLAGVPHTTTTNPDGSAINFWTPEFEGALATTVGLSNPHMAQADAYGNVYVADKASHSVLKITTDGKVRTFAGTHVDGFNGDGPAPATTLQISQPNGLYVLPNGIVYVLDPGNHRIRRVDLNGQMTTVINDTDPKWKSSGRALWVSQNEDLIYYTNEYQPAPGTSIADGAVVKKWTPSGGIESVCSKSVGFRNPGNIDVNPADGKLYVTDRAEDDPTGLATGLFRIDGIDQRTRMTGNLNDPAPVDGQAALHSYIQQTRGVAFLPDGSYFLCGHKDGSIWYVDTLGLLHRYLGGSGRRDGYSLPDDVHPPLTDQQYFAQPRSVTLAPDGNLLVVSNDSGFVFRVSNIVPSFATNLRMTYTIGSSATLNWNGVSGRGYRIEQSSDLSNWTGVTAVDGAFNGTAQYTTGSTAGAALFYRVLPAL